MGRITNLKDILGIIKDKASQSKAALLLSKPTLRLSLLRATSHYPFAPPHPKHIAALLSFGHGSRDTAAAAIEVLMDRLQTTQSSSVALKCLITVHHIIKHGSFILQDQLSVYPATGGRNYLKLSDFRDCSTPTTWELSSWVRWYARYLENLLAISRVLGFFLSPPSIEKEEEEEEEKVSGLMNLDLLREIDSLVGLVEEMSKKPDSLHVHSHKLVFVVSDLVVEDYLLAINEVWIRVSEFKERLSLLSFGESVELVCALKRVENCKDKFLVEDSSKKKDLIEDFWGLISEMKEKVGKEVCEGERRLLASSRRVCGVSESARFAERVKSGDSVGFSSRKLGLNIFSFQVLESVDLYG